MTPPTALINLQPTPQMAYGPDGDTHRSVGAPCDPAVALPCSLNGSPKDHQP
jgi:hypothetical protein